MVDEMTEQECIVWLARHPDVLERLIVAFGIKIDDKPAALADR